MAKKKTTSKKISTATKSKDSKKKKAAKESQKATTDAKEKKAPKVKEQSAEEQLPAFVEFEIPLDKIVLGEHQPRDRKGLEARGSLTRLRENIQEVGLLQPILVEERDDGTYLLISGERRYRACTQLGHKKIRAVLPSKKTFRSLEKEKSSLRELALFENLQRKDLTAIEEGRTFEELLKSLKIPQAELGERLGLDQAYISQRISFLKLPEEIQDMIEEGKINTTQARELTRLQKIRGKAKREEAQLAVAKKIEVEKLTYRKAKSLVDELLGTKKERDSSQLTRLGAKKAVYFISRQS